MKCSKDSCKTKCGDDELTVFYQITESYTIELCSKHSYELRRDAPFRTLRHRVVLEDLAVNHFEVAGSIEQVLNAANARFDAETALIRYVESWLAATTLPALWLPYLDVQSSAWATAGVEAGPVPVLV